MFGLFNSKLAPEGPVEFAASVKIDKPASEVYALVDWADERNAKLATGNKVYPIENKPNRFDMVMPFLPDLTFEFLVKEAVPHSKYAYGCIIKPGCGNLAQTQEAFEFEELRRNRCRVTLTCTTTFVDGLRTRDFTNEVATMAASVQSSLQKLKLQAELGAEVAKALEENTVL